MAGPPPRTGTQRQDVIADLLHARRAAPVAIVPTAGPVPTGLLDAGEAGRIARGTEADALAGRPHAAAAAASGALQIRRRARDLSGSATASRTARASVLRDALNRYGGATHLRARRARRWACCRRCATAAAFRRHRDPRRRRASAGDQVAAIGASGETLAATHRPFPRGDDAGPGPHHPAAGSAQPDDAAGNQRRGQCRRGAAAGSRCGVERRAGIVSAHAPSERAAAAVRCLLSGARAGALSPKSQKGTITELDRAHVSVLLLADVGKIAGERCRRGRQIRQQWRRAGALRRRAHGGRRRRSGAGASLRVGGRYLGSAMAWDQPQHLAPFPRRQPVQRPGDSRRSDGVAADPGRTQRRTGGPHLGAAGRRHAAGHRARSRARAGSCCSTSPPAPPGRRCRCRDFMWTCSSGCWRCRPARPHASWRGLSSLAPVSVLDGFGRLMPPTPTMRCPSRASDFAHTRRLGQASARPLRRPGVESALNALHARRPLTAAGGCRTCRAYGDVACAGAAALAAGAAARAVAA